MKAIQVMIDEALFERLDATEEVQAEGRSSVLRRAIEQYLRNREREEIAARYRRAYAAGVEELEGWADEGAWPST